MDKLDRKICILLQENSNSSAAEIGETAGLSASAVQRRIQKLKDKGVILDEVAILSQAAFDLNITLILNVTLTGDKEPEVKEFREIINNHPNIQQCYFVTGEIDYVLIFIAQSMDEYQYFTKDVLFAKEYVHTFTTQVVVEPIKRSLKLPLTQYD